MNPRQLFIPLLLISVLASASAALAQDKGMVDPKPLPRSPIQRSQDWRQGAVRPQGVAVGNADAGGRLLCKGCIAGAEGLPINGDSWQVMRLSRNRYWAIPTWSRS